jgi:AraC-like DNA-binding protein
VFASGETVSLSVLKNLIDALQVFVGSIDAPAGTGRLDESRKYRLLNGIADLSQGELGVLVAVLSQLLIRRHGSVNRVVVDRVLDVLAARTDDQETTERHARALIALLADADKHDSVPVAFPDTSSSSEADRVRMAVQFLESRSSGPVSLDEVAAHVGWSKWHCARVFKRHTGTGIAEFCRRVRVKRARRLLADSRLTVKEVAAAAGFTHASDLTRCFVRAYGLSPTSFRSARSFGGSH